MRFIDIKTLKDKKDFIKLFAKIKKLGFNRILVESGLLFLKSMIKFNIISNLYVFKSHIKLGNLGYNSTNISFFNKLKLKDRVNVNLKGENLFKIRINNV